MTESMMDASEPLPVMRVRSPDGVNLAVHVHGSGPPLVLVHGSLQDHSISAALVDQLAPHVTCYAMDRRGFGASSDRDGYDIEREFDDVAAVCAAVADRAGRPVHLWGHSFGASCAMGGAARSRDVARLVLYEPSLGLPYPTGVIDAIESAVAAGDADTAISTVLTAVLGMSEADVDTMRTTPEWARRLAVARTVARECRAEEAWVFTAGQFDGVRAPTLLLSGSESPQELQEATSNAATALPDARILVLDGHGHVAHRTHPADVAAIVLRFTIGPESTS